MHLARVRSIHKDVDYHVPVVGLLVLAIHCFVSRREVQMASRKWGSNQELLLFYLKTRQLFSQMTPFLAAAAVASRCFLEGQLRFNLSVWPQLRDYFLMMDKKWHRTRITTTMPIYPNTPFKDHSAKIRVHTKQSGIWKDFDGTHQRRWQGVRLRPAA